MFNAEYRDNYHMNIRKTYLYGSAKERYIQ